MQPRDMVHFFILLDADSDETAGWPDVKASRGEGHRAAGRRKTAGHCRRLGRVHYLALFGGRGEVLKSEARTFTP